ncbi:MAG: SCP2 sterol-binding domain-containing protein [Promethearchaeati archaeon]
MIDIQHPKDLLSVSIKNILSYRPDSEMIELLRNYNKKIIIELENFYPVMVIIQDKNISFNFGEKIGKADLKIKMDLNTLLDLAYKRLGLVKAVLTRRLKIKGIYKLKTVLRFKKIFLDTLKMLAADPNQNYYELNKNTR